MTDTHSQAFSLFGLPVYWYGLLIAFAVLLAILVAWLREKRLGLPNEVTINLTLWMLPIGLACARIYYVLFSWDSYKANPLDIFNIRQGGLAIYGGLIGGILVAFLYARKNKLHFLRLLDLFSPAVALAQAIGRWGNFTNQEAYGNLVTTPKLQFFPFSVFIAQDQSWHLATFFYESVWCFIIAVVILFLEFLGKLRRAGDAFLMYLMLYGFERTIVEGLRTDSLMLGSMRISQLLSALLFLVALGLLTYRRCKPDTIDER